MYVRLLSGRYAGEERDVRVDMAKQMLADGRAERVSPESAAVPALTSQPHAPQPKKKGRR